MENNSFLAVRLAFGYKRNIIVTLYNIAGVRISYSFLLAGLCSIISQCWCSFITFPLYVIVTQVRCLMFPLLQLSPKLKHWFFMVVDGFKVQKSCSFRKREGITIEMEKKSEGQATRFLSFRTKGIPVNLILGIHGN